MPVLDKPPPASAHVDIQLVEPEVKLLIRLIYRLKNTSYHCFFKLLGLVGGNLVLTNTPQPVSHLLRTMHSSSLGYMPNRRLGTTNANVIRRMLLGLCQIAKALNED